MACHTALDTPSTASPQHRQKRDIDNFRIPYLVTFADSPGVFVVSVLLMLAIGVGGLLVAWQVQIGKARRVVRARSQWQ